MSGRTNREQPIAIQINRELEYLSEGEDPSEAVSKINTLIDAYTSTLRSLSFMANFDGYVAKDIVFKAGETINIEHFLGTIPKFRIILRQVGNGVLTDIPSVWDNKVISLKNNGAEEVTATLLIARE